MDYHYCIDFSDRTIGPELVCKQKFEYLLTKLIYRLEHDLFMSERLFMMLFHRMNADLSKTVKIRSQVSDSGWFSVNINSVNKCLQGLWVCIECLT